MIKIKKKNNSKKRITLTGIVAAIGMAAIGFIMNFIFNIIFPTFQNIYTDTAIFISMSSPQSALFWLYPLTLGLALAYLWTKLKTTIMNFTWIYFFVGAVPPFFINAGSFNLPIMMIATWTLLSLLNGLVAAAIFNKMLK